ncbi:uncharacterized protein LOC115610804 [Strigops habroptila]|uniref:uncharacterized protein LOC115610804 n=1 Tax=Strigops habroptila TaxID=2489341 RepID=UPI0011CEFC41|nr:uncharacterized protein LOC115610804 [Strigops habroptila]
MGGALLVGFGRVTCGSKARAALLQALLVLASSVMDKTDLPHAKAGSHHGIVWHLSENMFKEGCQGVSAALTRASGRAGPGPLLPPQGGAVATARTAIGKELSGAAARLPSRHPRPASGQHRPPSARAPPRAPPPGTAPRQLWLGEKSSLLAQRQSDPLHPPLSVFLFLGRPYQEIHLTHLELGRPRGWDEYLRTMPCSTSQSRDPLHQLRTNVKGQKGALLLFKCQKSGSTEKGVNQVQIGMFGFCV